MKYTTKVKADLAVIISLLLLLTLLVCRIDNLSPICLALLATALVWNRHTRHLSHWNDIWARPKTEIIAMCVMFAACIFITFSFDVDIHFLDYSLIVIMGVASLFSYIGVSEASLGYSAENGNLILEFASLIIFGPISEELVFRGPHTNHKEGTTTYGWGIKSLNIRRY